MFMLRLTIVASLFAATASGYSVRGGAGKGSRVELHDLPLFQHRAAGPGQTSVVVGEKNRGNGATTKDEAKSIESNGPQRKFRREVAEYDYGIMFDAGSSGTRCYIYKWPKRVGTNVPLVESLWDEVKQEALSMKVEPGISEYASDLAGLEAKLAPLIAFAQASVPAEKHASSMMFLYATAGMRTLPYATQDLIYSRITSLFSSSGFGFDPDNIGTITGTSEAYYGWVAVNFMSNTFKADGPGLGALDLGGASTQITVAVDDASPVHGLLTARFNGREYTLYAQSFLGYGANLFSDKIKAAASVSGGGVDPCLLVGTPANYSSYNNVSLEGGSSYADCVTAAVTAFELVDEAACYTAAGTSGGCAGLTSEVCACTIEGNGRPTIDVARDFVGMSNFDLILQGNLKVPSVGGWPDIANANTKDYCSLNWTAAVNSLPSSTKLQYVASTCTTAVQATGLMSTAYQLDENKVVFERNIGKFEVTWALGAMVSRANLVAAEPAEPKLSELESAAIGAGSAVALIGLIVVTLVISKKYVCTSGSTRSDSYNPIVSSTANDALMLDRSTDHNVYEAM